MDRLEQDQTRKPLHGMFAPTRGRDSRPRGGLIRPESAGGPVAEGSQVRLDSGHHQSRSRWVRRNRVRDERSPGDRLEPAGCCSVVVASREARVLAAMVNWITRVDLDPAAGFAPGAGETWPRATDDSGCHLAMVGGRAATDPAGLIRFRAVEGASGRSYLLTPRDQEGAEPIPADGLIPPTIERYSLLPGSDWWAGDLRGSRGCYRFRAYQQGEFRTEVRLRVPGSDQVLPALAAVAIGVRMHLSPRWIKERLEEYSGVPRGFESRGSFRGATLVDDEALGSGAVAAALGLAREVFGRRTLRAIYWPDSPAAWWEPPAAVEFTEADHLIVVDPHASESESTRLLAASLRSSGASVVFCSSLDRAIRVVDRDLEPGDVLVTLGAGEVGTIADAFLRRLSRDRHG